MARIVSIDYGAKRTGLATTDPFQIIVNALTTVQTTELKSFLSQYMMTENVEKVVIGYPKHKDGNDTYLTKDVVALGNWLAQQWPKITIAYADEQFTSMQAKEIILKSGVPKEKRKDKSLVDKVSAVLILQKYLGHI
ncbi:MAG: Holliday junction resolvase RuvX [Saprospiraceae bacterium]